jgi:hypothetical protein
MPAGLVGDEGGQRGQRDKADDGDGAVGVPPAEMLPEGGAGRDADDVGDGESEEHPRHGPPGSFGGDQSGGHDSAHAEQCSVRQARQEPCGEEQAEGRSESGGDVADHEHGGQQEQESFVGDARADAGQDGCPDDDTERVGGDEVAGVRHGHADAVGDLGQQSHRGELGRTDSERNEGKGQQGQWHGAQVPFTGGGSGADGREGGGTVMRPVRPVSVACRADHHCPMRP